MRFKTVLFVFLLSQICFQANLIASATGSKYTRVNESIADIRENKNIHLNAKHLSIRTMNEGDIGPIKEFYVKDPNNERMYDLLNEDIVSWIGEAISSGDRKGMCRP